MLSRGEGDACGYNGTLIWTVSAFGDWGIVYRALRSTDSKEAFM